MTDEQIEEKALKAYPPEYEQEDFDETRDMNQQYRESYIQALKKINALPKIKGWIARNKEYNELIFVPGDESPIRMETYWLAGFTWGYTKIPDIFPDLKWESEPLEVELIINKI